MKADESGAEAGPNIWEQINLSIEKKDAWNFASSQLKLALFTALKCIYYLLSKPFFLFDCLYFQSRRPIKFQEISLLVLFFVVFFFFFCPPSNRMIWKPYENCTLTRHIIIAQTEPSLNP